MPIPLAAEVNGEYFCEPKQMCHNCIFIKPCHQQQAERKYGLHDDYSYLDEDISDDDVAEYMSYSDADSGL